MFIIQILGIKKFETVSYIQYVYVLDCMYQKEGNCIISIVCLCSRLYVSKRGKLYPNYNMSMFQTLCVRKWETVSYLQFFFILDCMHQKERNCIISTVCLCSSFFVFQKEGNRIIPTKCLCSIICVSERKKLYYSYSMFMSYFLYIRKGETAAYLGYAEGLKFVFHKEGKCIMPMVCLQSSLCIMCLF